MQCLSSAARGLIGVLALGLALTFALPLAGANAIVNPGSPDAVSQSVKTPRSGWPLFTAPTWMPTRGAVTVGCVLNNCTLQGAPHHGYWAIDFVGYFGQPVFAAGAGIAHVGGANVGCQNGQPVTAYWMWIDHGGGDATKYDHLSGLSIREGQVVTPDTQIATMGEAPDACGQPIVHMETRFSGPKGFPVATEAAKLPPNPLKACTGAGLQVFPNALGFGGWGEVPYGRYTINNQGTGCTGQLASAGSPRSVAAKGLKGAVSISWKHPVSNAGLVDGYRIQLMYYYPAQKAWLKSGFVALPRSANGKTFTGLKPHGQYRAYISVHDPNGSSNWVASPVVKTANKKS